MRKLAILPLVVALFGCQSVELDGGRSKTIAWLQTQGMDKGAATMLADNKPALRRYLYDRGLAGQDDQYCRSLGAKPGTDAYINCRTSVSASRPVANSQPQIVVERPQPVYQTPQQPEVVRNNTRCGTFRGNVYCS